MSSRRAGLFFFLAAITGAVLSSLMLVEYDSSTVLAGVLIWGGLGLVNALAFWFSRRGAIQFILYGSLMKVVLGLILIGGIALALQPALRPTLLNAVLAILVMQGLHIALSL